MVFLSAADGAVMAPVLLNLMRDQTGNSVLLHVLRIERIEEGFEVAGIRNSDLSVRLVACI